MPRIYAIGGPNGAGKTTASMALFPHGLECPEYVNADAIAAGDHHIPEDVVRRRYVRGIQNFLTLYTPLARTWDCMDNSLGKSILCRKVHFGGYERQKCYNNDTRSRHLAENTRDNIMTDNEIQAAFTEGMRVGVQRALAEHKRMGRSIVVERDGKIVEIPPEEIVVAEEFLDPPLRKAL